MITTSHFPMYVMMVFISITESDSNNNEIVKKKQYSSTEPSHFIKYKVH